MEGDQGDLARLVYITHSHSAPSIWSLSETLKTYSSLEQVTWGVFVVAR